MFPYYKKSDYRLTLLYTGVLLAVLLWCAMIIGAPLLRGGSPTERTVAGVIKFFLAPACHQMEERCFYLADHALPVCSRCSGIYFGFLIGVILFPIVKKTILTIPKRRYLLIAGLPLLLDALLSKAGLWESGLYGRFITGLFPGAVAVFYIIPPLNTLIAKKEVYND